MKAERHYATLRTSFDCAPRRCYSRQANHELPAKRGDSRLAKANGPHELENRDNSTDKRTNDMDAQTEAHPATKNNAKGIAYVLASAICFALAGVLIKAIDWSALAVSGGRSFFAAIGSMPPSSLANMTTMIIAIATVSPIAADC